MVSLQFARRRVYTQAGEGADESTALVNIMKSKAHFRSLPRTQAWQAAGSKYVGNHATTDKGGDKS